MQPRHSPPDAFEQNPLSEVSERISIKATEGLDDAGRVREAMRIVIAEGVSIAEAARRCNVAPSFLAEWREKYLALLNEESSIAGQPLMEEGAILKDADLVQIPEVAREHFAENWERLVELTRATASTFRQHPLQLFLENSSLTGWLYNEGKLDRGVFAGVMVVLSVLVLAATFLIAGRFYRQEGSRPEPVENLDASIRRAAEVAKNFFKAETAAEKMEYVRADGPARDLMEEYFERHPAEGFPGVVLTTAMPDANRYALEFEMPTLDRKHFCVVVNQGGKLLVDWETCSLFQEANIEEIRKKKPHRPVRVAARVVAGTYYNFGFTAEKFTCFSLFYPGLELDLFGYAGKDSAAETTLKALLDTPTESERQVTAILEVKYPEGAGDVPSNQVEIVRLVSEDWVAP